MSVKKLKNPTENSSGYSWRNVSLTFKDVIYLLAWHQKVPNAEIADYFNITRDWCDHCSSNLRKKLRFRMREDLVIELKKSKLFKMISKPILENILDNVSPKMPIYDEYEYETGREEFIKKLLKGV